MKKSLYYLTVALLCCGQSALFAQVRNLEGTPSLAPRFAANPYQVDADGVPLVPAESQPANPFNMLPAEAANNAQPAQPSYTSVQPEIAAPSDPASLPVNSNLGTQENVIDTMANDATIGAVPNAAYAPVDWCCNQIQAPNHVAQVLMRQECVDGLWARYPAQRAHECAHMWHKLTLKKGHGCNNGCCDPCVASCGQGCGDGCCSVNRYQNSGCDSCAHCAATANAETMAQAERMATLEIPTVR